MATTPLPADRPADGDIRLGFLQESRANWLREAAGPSASLRSLLCCARLADRMTPMAPSVRPFRSILVPLDGFPFAEQAVPLALAIDGPRGARCGSCWSTRWRRISSVRRPRDSTPSRTSTRCATTGRRLPCSGLALDDPATGASAIAPWVALSLDREPPGATIRGVRR